MNTTTPTPPTKTRRMPGKKVILVVLALVLAAGAAGAYLYRNRPESKQATNTKQTDAEDTDTPEPLEQVDPNDVAARYAFSQDRLDDVDEMSAAEKVTLYTSLAYDGAALDKKEARDYAKTALELVPEEDDDDEATAAIRTVLKEVAAGNYANAKSIVLSALES